MKNWPRISFLDLFCLAMILDYQTVFAEDAAGSAQHQEKALYLKNVKPKPNPAYDRESSSYMGDPDPLDPIKVKNESFKEDEEPVLNEIRHITNVPSEAQAPLTSEPTPEKPMLESNVVDEAQAVSPVQPVVKVKKVTKKKKTNSVDKRNNNKTKKAKIKKQKSLIDDEADLALEKKFYRIYQKYNSKPTPPAAWARVAGNRKSHTYTVQSGDTLWSISGVLFGDRFFWPKLWAVNRQGIENPHQIEPGLSIHFYPGSDRSIPGLEMDSNESSSDHLSEWETLETSDQLAQQQSDGSSDVKIQLKGVTPLPDSIPIWTNKIYFAKKRDMKIELGENINVVTQTKNNIILSAEKLTSDFEIPLEQISRGGRCDTGTIYKKIVAAEGQQPVGEYYILQPLDEIETAAEQIVRPYEIMGSGSVHQDQFSVHDCHALMTTNFVFIPKSRMDLIRNQSISGVSSNEIIGGSDLGDQKLFAVDQIVYLSLGSSNVSNGQVVKLKSQINDKLNGQVKILDRFGNYAVGILTEVNDVIEKGDEVIF